LWPHKGAIRGLDVSEITKKSKNVAMLVGGTRGPTGGRKVHAPEKG